VRVIYLNNYHLSENLDEHLSIVLECLKGEARKLLLRLVWVNRLRQSRRPRSESS
jgi:hypothetical protein